MSVNCIVKWPKRCNLTGTQLYEYMFAEIVFYLTISLKYLPMATMISNNVFTSGCPRKKVLIRINYLIEKIVQKLAMNKKSIDHKIELRIELKNVNKSWTPDFDSGEHVVDIRADKLLWYCFLLVLLLLHLEPFNNWLDCHALYKRCEENRHNCRAQHVLFSRAVCQQNAARERLNLDQLAKLDTN